MNLGYKLYLVLFFLWKFWKIDKKGNKKLNLGNI